MIAKIVFLLCVVSYVTAVKLGSYNIDESQITVSGISSGAAMANQLHVAYSSVFSGVGIVTGPPYYCAEGSTLRGSTTCMSGLIGLITMSTLFNKVQTYESKGQIDSTSNLKNDKVYIYHGTADAVVAAHVAKKNEDFYKNYVSNPSSQIKTMYSILSNHGFITNNYGYACAVLNLYSYINNCGYNQAFEILKHLHGASIQEPTKSAKATGTLIEFDQKEFFPSGTTYSIIMDSIGYAYVPKRCAEKNLCKLHVALHGCGQGRYRIGSDFAVHTGYNEVADLNDIIILYPQADSSLLSNPNGCWDWWGFTSTNYATKSGPQLMAIKGMVDRIVAK